MCLQRIYCYYMGKGNLLHHHPRLAFVWPWFCIGTGEGLAVEQHAATGVKHQHRQPVRSWRVCKFPIYVRASDQRAKLPIQTKNGRCSSRSVRGLGGTKVRRSEQKKTTSLLCIHGVFQEFSLFTAVPTVDEGEGEGERAREMDGVGKR